MGRRAFMKMGRRAMYRILDFHVPLQCRVYIQQEDLEILSPSLSVILLPYRTIVRFFLLLLVLCHAQDSPSNVHTCTHLMCERVLQMLTHLTHLSSDGWGGVRHTAKDMKDKVKRSKGPPTRSRAPKLQVSFWGPTPAALFELAP